ncbi:hypothetical protein FUT69_04255 [Xylella taiwanensis]|uniref:Uncharacterized protein n=2 Tax=Xylella taiwanensis TaxID=1444770 RepID=A0ABS8TTU7_9GAMM|nr:hypothetical protein [Xylella taiwanensis]MCD8455272.1 hypothetical protein [Xylella taiwanensis]MCD8464123.1 hypothetical protein [Xylella taiwanensis]MCD8464319.1 hypothetical protein [Xylella taiwanensis]MCD8468120.1 hypothetical protein [Xylella taiwanensis]MCD8469539.1 hypothetical protein [Xylella taiwanensis]
MSETPSLKMEDEVYAGGAGRFRRDGQHGAVTQGCRQRRLEAACSIGVHGGRGDGWRFGVAQLAVADSPEHSRSEVRIRMRAAQIVLRDALHSLEALHQCDDHLRHVAHDPARWNTCPRNYTSSTPAHSAWLASVHACRMPIPRPAVTLAAAV